jgi:hypothetical protein
LSRYKEDICIACGEKKKIQARGLCFKHYKRWERHDGNTSDPDYVNKGKGCKIEGCNNDAAYGGICHKHYLRKRKYGDPNAFLSATYEKDEKCLVVGCDHSPRAEFLCHNHYCNYMYHKRLGHLQDVAQYIDYKLEKPDRRFKRSV